MRVSAEGVNALVMRDRVRGKWSVGAEQLISKVRLSFSFSFFPDSDHHFETGMGNACIRIRIGKGCSCIPVRGRFVIVDKRHMSCRLPDSIEVTNIKGYLFT